MLPPSLYTLLNFDMRPLHLFVLVCGLASSSLAQERPFDPNRFEATELATELLRPMELDVADDGRVFFIELGGKLKVLQPGKSSVELVGELDVFEEQENGLIGMALDPNFSKNNHIFLQYSPPDYPGQHISRFTLVDGKLDLGSEKLLLKFEEQRIECCHHAGSLEFGPDGNLFIGTGDNTHPGGDSQGYAPIDERPGKAPWDAQKSAANTNQLSGKILRIRPTTDGEYEIPDGNLFPDGVGGRPEIYVMGCRNPWRLNVDQKSGFVYWGEVGPDAWNNNDRGPRGYDEINQARAAGNFGWPYFIADNQAYADVDFESGTVGVRYDPARPVNESPFNTGAKILPPAEEAFIYYPYGYSEKFPELGEGGRTACAGPVYHFDPSLDSATKFPKEFDNTLLIFEWTRHWIKAVHLDADSNIRRIEPFMGERKFRRPIDLTFGPEGSLYLIEYGETWGINKDAKLVRVDYISGNRRPRAIASVQNNVGREPLAVQFSSEGTFDKDAEDQLSYEWVSIATGQDGQEVDRTTISTEANPTVTFQAPGVFHVELTVRDREGASATASVPVLVGNAAPELRILEPVGGFFDPGQPIRYELFVNDAEDGTNDYDLADELDLPEIDGDSSGRASVNARKISGKFAMEIDSSEASPPGLTLMKGSDCFNCHDVHQKRVGPPLIEVSRKYRDDAHALARSVDRVIQGSTGAWGKIPMIPHKQHSREEVYAMVQWIYGLRDAGAMQVVRGFVGEVPVDPQYSGGVMLEASYTDLGVEAIPPTSSTVTMRLRSRHAEAEHANHLQGVTPMKSETARNGTFLGSINHNHFLRFDDIDTGAVGNVTARVASAGPGGYIEIRCDELEGPLLARIRVASNGAWEQWRDETAKFATTEGFHDVFVVFVKETDANALMNIDSIYFHPVE